MEIAREDAQTLWTKLSTRTWGTLYDLLYNDYYEGHRIGLNRDLVYHVMQVAQINNEKNVSFPETSEDFYETLTDQLTR